MLPYFQNAATEFLSRTTVFFYNNKNLYNNARLRRYLQSVTAVRVTDVMMMTCSLLIKTQLIQFIFNEKQIKHFASFWLAAAILQL